MSSMDQTKQVTTAIREWLDQNNQARETADGIVVARATKALQEVAQWLVHVKQGHARVRTEVMPLLLTIDVLIALSANVNALYQASRPLAHDLVRFLRSMEESIRTQLGDYTGTPVPQRSLAHDAVEDEHLAKPAPVAPTPAPPTPQLKLVLS